MKRDRKLFAQIFIAVQVRGRDVQELKRGPPSISKEGEIRSGNKADLLPCLKDDREFPTTEPISQSAALEGLVLVNMLKPKNSKTFTDYAEDIFPVAISKKIIKFDWVDI